MSEIKVLATVNGKEITKADADLLLQSIGPQRAMQFYSEEGQKQLLNELINQELIYLDAVDSKIEEEEEFKKEMEIVKTNVIKQFAITKILKKASVNDEEAKSFYDENKDMFKQVETVQASHILVDSEDKAKEIIKELNDGLEFAQGAKQYSSCPSNQRDGDLGSFSRGQMVPEFDKAVFEMEVGSITNEPVKTQFGYHVIKLVEKTPERVQEFDEVKENVTNQLLAKKQGELYMQKAEELKDKYPVEIK